MYRFMQRKMSGAIAAGAFALLAAAQPAQAQSTYNVSISLDYSGPFAAVMDSWYGGQQSVFDWWNETRGKTLGVKLNVKTYDMRYDASQVARTWLVTLIGVLSTHCELATTNRSGYVCASLTTPFTWST